MTTKKNTTGKTTKAAGKTTTKAKAATVKASDKKLSQTEAAVRVLAKAKQPMTCKSMVEAMAKQGLWTSPGGATPDATLYAAILREIHAKGKAARFHKVDRGQFALTSDVPVAVPSDRHSSIP